MIQTNWISTIVISLLLATGAFFLGRGCAGERLIHVMNPVEASILEMNETLVTQVKSQEMALKQLRKENKDLAKTASVRPTKIIKVQTVIRDTIRTGGSWDGWEWSSEEDKDEAMAWWSAEDRSLKYKDKWAEFEAIGDQVRYSVRDSISLLEFKQGGDRYLRAFSHNPNTVINDLEYLIEKDRRRIGLGLQLGVTYDTKVRPYVGLGVSWDFVRF